MTEQEAAEYNRLLDRYNSLVAENNRLLAEIETGVDNCQIMANNITVVGRTVTKDVAQVSGEIGDAQDVVNKLHECLLDVTRNYFLFKNLSEASKKLTKYNDEYYTKFKFYNELRRITLGYVIGIDSHIVSNEALRKKVEKAYLANTDYWLAYAITAVMLWVSDEKEAAYRALNKSLSLDSYKSCVFFMLVNLRFGRTQVACNWYLALLEKTDVNNMSDEWRHVLHTYLAGALHGDKQFSDLVSDYFKNMIEQTEATYVDFSKKVTDRAKNYAASFIHLTDNDYPTLKECCAEYEQMKMLLSNMEKISTLAQHFDEIYQTKPADADNMFERIENILYDLINGYDEQEYKLIKGMRENEAILAANGNLDIAKQRYREMYGDDKENKRFGDLMLQWAFDDDKRRTAIIVRRFSLAYLKDRIAKGCASFFTEEHTKLKERYTLTINTTYKIESCEVTCNENEYEQAAEKVSKHYNKNRFHFIMADKYIKIFLLMCVGALVLLAIAALTVSTKAFPVLLILGIALGVIGGFLVWRRWVDVGKELAEYTRLALVKLRQALEEMGAWRKLVTSEYANLEDLTSAIDRF